MDVALERKLRELLDRHEIYQVLLRYGRGLDRLDRELVRSCYFDDAIEDHGRFVGYPDAFIDWADRATRHFVRQQHGISNHTCELAGADAHCETYYLFIGMTQQGPHFMSSGRYIDHFQRRNGEWRIANRVTLVEGKFDVTASALGADVPSAYGKDDAQPATRDRGDASYQRPVRPRKPLPMK